jgi:putative membrane protein
MFNPKLACCAFYLLTLTGAAMAADEPSTQDKQFLAAAASGGMLEVRLGQYASFNASSEEVKKFAEHMVGDHTQANQQLKGLTTQQPLEIPKVLNEEDQSELDRLEKLKGSELDKAYVEQMVKDHEQDVAAFEKESTDGSDSIVKAFAERTLPVLKHHLEMAKDLSKSIGA